MFSIRRYFREQDATDYINTGMLLRHALSFGLYLLGTSATGIAEILLSFKKDSQSIDNYYACLFFESMAQCISMTLLLEIF